MRAKTFVVAAIAALTVGTGGCVTTESKKEVAEGWSASAAIRRLPLASIEEKPVYTITIADFSKLDRPSDPSKQQDWLIGLAQDKRFPILLPDILGGRGGVVEGAEEFFGFDPLGIGGFVEASSPPNGTAVFDQVDELSDKVRDIGDGMKSYGEGEDFESDFSSASPANPIGLPIRVAQRDGLTLFSRSTKVTKAWIANGDSVGDDPFAAAIAEQLDTVDPVVATIVRDDFLSAAGVLGSLDTVPGSVVPADPLDPTQRFLAVGLAWAIEGDTPILASYGFLSEAAAKKSMARIERSYSAVSFMSREQISSLVEFIGIEQAGSVVNVRLRPVGDRSAGVVLQMLTVRDTPFSNP